MSNATLSEERNGCAKICWHVGQVAGHSRTPASCTYVHLQEGTQMGLMSGLSEALLES